MNHWMVACLIAGYIFMHDFNHIYIANHLIVSYFSFGVDLAVSEHWL